MPAPSSLPKTHFPHGCEAAHSAVAVPGVHALETTAALLVEDVSNWIHFSKSMQHVSVRQRIQHMTGEKTLKGCGRYLVPVGVPTESQYKDGKLSDAQREAA